jgi:hypothetical protein
MHEMAEAVRLRYFLSQYVRVLTIIGFGRAVAWICSKMAETFILNGLMVKVH